MSLSEAREGMGIPWWETGVLALLGLGAAGVWALRAANAWLRYGK